MLKRYISKQFGGKVILRRLINTDFLELGKRYISFSFHKIKVKVNGFIGRK
jgi:hypothetical protein